MKQTNFDIYERIAGLYGIERAEAEREIRLALSAAWETADAETKALLHFCGLPDAAVEDVIFLLAGYVILGSRDA